MNAIELRSVAYSTGSRKILEDVDFSVAEGGVFGLLGPSGCGKSTTLRLISGLALPTKGSVLVFGESASSYEGKKRPVATVWQSRALFPHMSVRENIEFGLKVKDYPRSDRRRIVGAMADKLGLAEKLDGPVAHLSGGEQQRIALGRALVTRPRVLLLDEPFTGLDQRLKLQLQADLRDLQAEYGCTYVLVSHAYEDVFSLADSMAVIDRGRIVQVGSPADVYSSPGTPLVAELVGHKNLVPGFVRGLSEDQGRVFVDTGVGAWWAQNRIKAEHNDSVYYVIDPHNVELGAIGDQQQADAVFKAKESMGSYEVLFLRLQAGSITRELRIERRQGIREALPPIGAAVRISWNDKDAFVLRR